MKVECRSQQLMADGLLDVKDCYRWRGQTQTETDGKAAKKNTKPKTLSVIFSSTGSSLDSDVCRNLLGCMSAAQNVRMSMAVSRVCLRDGTNTITGFFSACFRIAWYVGFAIAIIRDALCVMLKPCIRNNLHTQKYVRK